MGISAIALDGARQPAGAFENDKAEDASLIVELSSIFRTGIKRPRTASLASEKQEAVASASGRPGSNRPKLYSHPESTDPDPAPAYPVSIKQRVVKASSEPVKKTEDKDEGNLQKYFQQAVNRFWSPRLLDDEQIGTTQSNEQLMDPVVNLVTTFALAYVERSITLGSTNLAWNAQSPCRSET